MIDQIFGLKGNHIEDSASKEAILGFASQLVSSDTGQTWKLLEQLREFAQAADHVLWPEPLAILLGHSFAISDGDWPPADLLDPLLGIYHLCPADHVLRNLLLALIARPNSARCMEAWADLLCDDPPLTADAIDLAFRPVLAEDRVIPVQLLIRLVHGATGNLSVAAAVYDLANHAFRTGKVTRHPAADRCPELCGLLGGLVGQLSRIEEGELPPNAAPESIAQTVTNSVALIISVIDTLALLNDERAIGKLNQAMGLRHRRIQVEAAAALTRLKEENGQRKLIDCAQHPVVRQRVIAYAKELGIENGISLEFKGPIATAESHLAMWLAEPGQMGLAPSQMHLIDQRHWYWPSFENPMDCFLFEFQYGSGDDAYRNIGISGPLTHAFPADLRQLSTFDQYAAFAGWQTVSPDIFLVPIERAESLLAGQTSRLKRALDRHSLHNQSMKAVSVYFGRHMLVAIGDRDEEPGTLIVDDDEADWISGGNPHSRITWQLALDIWRGRKLLDGFNPSFDPAKL